jgi:hypothetical protein
MKGISTNNLSATNAFYHRVNRTYVCTASLRNVCQFSRRYSLPYARVTRPITDENTNKGSESSCVCRVLG